MQITVTRPKRITGLSRYGTITNAITSPSENRLENAFLFSVWYSMSPSRSIDWKNTSIPLFFHSCRPEIATNRLLSATRFCSKASAERINAARAIARSRSKDLPTGTKLGSKPFGVTISTCLSSSCLHSLAVISLTVVKQSAQCAAIFSTECLLTIFSSSAIWSP